ncbi:MAG: hypothetical protein ACLFUX_05295 [Spirochaetaceae bacterium]
MERQFELGRRDGDEPEYRNLGEKYLESFNRALRRESVTRTVAELAWTAGPVTYLALTIGYRAGFGTAPPGNLFVYFAIYTLVAGLFAVATRLAYRMFRAQPAEEAAERLKHVMSTIPELIASTRNVTLDSYEGNDRVVLAAKYVLDNPDAGEAALEQVTRDLTGSAHLAERLRAVEIYRRMGLWTRSLDINREVSGELAAALELIRPASPQVARTLKRRFIGLGPSAAEGRTRTEGFIERVLAAGEEDNSELMTLADVEEVLTLAFELLAERRFTILSFDYHGIPRFGAAFGRVERLRREYRHLVHTRNNRLRALAERLNRADEIHRVAAAIPVLGDADEVLQNVLAATDHYFTSLARQTRPLYSFLRGKRSAVAHREKPFAQSVLKLYGALYRVNLDLRKKHVELERAIRDYQRVRRAMPASQLRLLAPDDNGQGIRLRRRTLAVEGDARTEPARELHKLLADISVTPRFFRAVIDAAGTERRYMSPEGYKHLAVSVLLVLDRAVGLSRPQVQYAVEATRAPNLGIVDRMQSREVRLGRALSLVHEVRPNLETAVERVLRSLVSYHGVRPSEELMVYLEREFGVPRDLAAFMTPAEEDRRAELRQEMKRQILTVPPTPKRYTSVIERL